MNLELLNIRTQAVQDFLWKHVEPTDLRFDFTRLDAIKEIERSVYAHQSYLLGDLEAGLVFRVVSLNPAVCQPHVMGDGRRIRSAMKAGLPWVWAMGFKKVAIWTQHHRIARIVERLGFQREAVLTRMHMDAQGNLLDTFVLTMEK